MEYFENSILLENALLPYFCEEEPLKSVNKKFNKLNYEKYLTYIQPHGILEIYHIITKIIQDRKNYKNGKLNGLFEEWYIDNKLEAKTEYKHGLSEIRKIYKNGELHGLYEEWSTEGKLIRRYDYKNGKRDGIRIMVFKWSII